MSVRRLVEVACDGPAPGVECPHSRAWSAAGTAADLRARMAAVDGWKTGQAGGVDQCPDCKSPNLPPHEGSAT